jgi:hypothetical protein
MLTCSLLIGTQSALTDKWPRQRLRAPAGIVPASRARRDSCAVVLVTFSQACTPRLPREAGRAPSPKQARCGQLTACITAEGLLPVSSCTHTAAMSVNT